MQQQFDQLTMDEIEADANLLDCYRIAIDFGMPAAIKAYEKLTLSSVDETVELKDD